MRPIFGVITEILGLGAVLLIFPYIPTGIPLTLYVAITQFIATYLVHCPAHYIVGAMAGIRFRSMRLGRTTLARVLPSNAAGLARLLPILTLSVERSSLSKASKRAAASMYASGTIASSSAAVIVAAVATPNGSLTTVTVAWTIAVVYVLFDLVFSPKGGDLMRTRAALRS